AFLNPGSALKKETLMKTELEGRTMEFTVAIIKCVRTLPKALEGVEVGRQLLRSAGSIGANYREANRAESKSDFVHKIGLAEKEASETGYWLEVCLKAALGAPQTIKTLLNESVELLAILTTRSQGKGEVEKRKARKRETETSKPSGGKSKKSFTPFPRIRAFCFFVSAFPISRFPLFQFLAFRFPLSRFYDFRFFSSSRASSSASPAGEPIS